MINFLLKIDFFQEKAQILIMDSETKKKATRKTPPKITPQNTHTTKLKFKKPKQNTIHDQKQSPPYFSYPPLSMLKENTKHE